MLNLSLLEFRFTSGVPGLIWEFVEFLLHSFKAYIIPDIIGNKSVEWNICSLLEFDLLMGWLTR